MADPNQFESFKLHNVKYRRSSNFYHWSHQQTLSLLKERQDKKQPKGFFPEISSNTPKKRITQFPPAMMFFKITYEKSILLRKNVKTMQNWSTTEIQRNLPWLKWNFLDYHLLELKTIVTSRKFWQKNMFISEEILQWYNYEDVFHTSEFMMKVVAFKHRQCIRRLNLGCILPNHAHKNVHWSISANFYPATERQNLLEKIRQKTVGGTSIIFS